MRRLLSIAAVVATTTLSAAALAQPTEDDASRAAARALGYEGVAAYKAGDYTTAADKLGRAFDVVQVPTLGLWLARALVQAGRLVEASERYGEVTRLTVTGGKIEAQLAAQERAGKERGELQPIIPTVRITLQGAPADEVTVTVDGVDFPTALLDSPRPVDPGDRRIVGKRGETVVTEEVSIAQGQHRAVILRFPVAAKEGPAPEPAPLPEPEPAPPETWELMADQPTQPVPLQRTLGWVALGLGGAGILTGTITGVMAMAERNSVSDDCPDDRCPPGAHDDADSIDTLRHVSTGSFIVGGIAAAAGVALVLTAPTPPPDVASVRPWIGVGSAGVTGTF